MINKVNEANYKAMSDLIDENEKKLWDLYRKIGGSYKSRFDTYKDMIALGELALAIQQVKKHSRLLVEE